MWSANFGYRDILFKCESDGKAQKFEVYRDGACIDEYWCGKGELKTIELFEKAVAQYRKKVNKK